MELIWNYPPGPTLPLLFVFDITRFHLGISGAMPERMRNVSSSSWQYNLYFFRKTKIEKLPHAGIVISTPVSCSHFTISQILLPFPLFSTPIHKGHRQGHCWKANCFRIRRAQADRLEVWGRSIHCEDATACPNQVVFACVCMQAWWKKGRNYKTGSVMMQHNSPNPWCLGWPDVSESRATSQARITELS